MFGYIYKTTDLSNGKIYVGRHVSSYFRGLDYVGSGNIIKSIVSKCERENIPLNKRLFVELIDTAEDNDELNEKEVYWIELLDCRNPNVGYNLRKGGTCGPGGPMMLGKHHSEETKLKMSLSRRGSKNSNYGNHRIMPEEEKKLHGCPGDKNGMYGKHFSEESKSKIREKNSGTRRMTNSFIYPKYKMIKINQVEEYLSKGWSLWKVVK